MQYKVVITYVPLLAVLAGCAPSGPNMPLVFGQSHTVGVSIGTSAAGQGGELTLGYKDYDLAIVPVTASQSDGTNAQLKSKAETHEDALSVLGQFELNSDAKQVDVGLGKFFATGMAATKLADGFKNKLSNTNGVKENEK